MMANQNKDVLKDWSISDLSTASEKGSQKDERIAQNEQAEQEAAMAENDQGRC